MIARCIEQNDQKEFVKHLVVFDDGKNLELLAKDPQDAIKMALQLIENLNSRITPLR
jgi:hypothetical protein